MALHCIRFLRLIKKDSILLRTKTIAVTIQTDVKVNKLVNFKTENKLVYLEDPDMFGTLSKSIINQVDKLDEEGDIKEQEYHKNIPLKTQKLTIKQYADLIKQYIAHKRLKEAIDVLEVRMLTVDRVKPENYIYNILIGACSDVGYTKKAFKLYNDMKRRGLKPTGDTYTCLFQACINSPWASDGLKNAKHLRELMIHKGIEPNITNFNVMVKAFGRCGDLKTAFQIVDEMISKKIKIRVHTFNHLLHACISDKNTGLRHALVVWRKMLRMREKPNLYSFNLMLKCAKDCNLGSKEDIEELIYILRNNVKIGLKHPEHLQIETSEVKPHTSFKEENMSDNHKTTKFEIEDTRDDSKNDVNKNLVLAENNVTVNIVNLNKLPIKEERSVPNLLSNVIQMQNVLALQEIHTMQDKFAVLGGQDDFLKEMNVYSVKPDIKTFTQMLPLLNETREAEIKLLETMESLNVKADIDFYNNLIKVRCLRSDYDGAFDVKDIIREQNKIRKKRHPLKKKLQLKFNIMTYGVLALACRTKESAEELLKDMRENQLKINIEILGTLLKNGAIQNQFDYVLHIMELTKEEKVTINQTFIKHLQTFCAKCQSKVQKLQRSEDGDSSDTFEKSYISFISIYKRWLKEINIDDALKTEHPWQQFRENYPKTVQRCIFIEEPKKFYKRSRKFVHFTPKI